MNLNLVICKLDRKEHPKARYKVECRFRVNVMTYEKRCKDKFSDARGVYVCKKGDTQCDCGTVVPLDPHDSVFQHDAQPEKA